MALCMHVTEQLIMEQLENGRSRVIFEYFSELKEFVFTYISIKEERRKC